MLNTILGTKQAMTQVFVEGKRIPVTKVVTKPCKVTAIKRDEKDGYWAVQLGFGKKSNKSTPKSLKTHLKDSYKDSSPVFIREAKLDSEPDMKVGDEIDVASIFGSGDVVSVTSVGKGKGFAGGVKRWGFGGGPKTHGQSDRHRAPGSIGQGSTPGRVRKGKKMAGRMGTEKTTIKNLKIVDVDTITGEILISGPIAGHVNSPVIIKLLKKVSPATDENQTENQPNEQQPKEDNS